MKLDIGAVRIVAAACGLFAGVRTSTAQVLQASLGLMSFYAVADRLPLPPGSQGVLVSVSGADKLAFEVVFETGAGGKFVTVTPSSGVAPMEVRIALDPQVVPYLRPGGYALDVRFGVSGEACSSVSRCTDTIVTLKLDAQPAPTIGAVVSAASFQPAVSPGEIISIFGQHIGTPPLIAQPDEGGFFPKTLGNTTVTFNGTPAPLLYVDTGQVNAVVPYGVAGQKAVSVVLTHSGQTAAVFSVPIADTSPSLFTLTQTGKGQGAILNVDSQNPNNLTLNGVDNPAPKGSAITIFGTGAGGWNRTVQDGNIVPDASTLPAAAVSLTIGGQPARILYAGAAPSLVSGVLQVNAIVPDGVASGPQPVVLTVGPNNNAQQQVTVAVR